MFDTFYPFQASCERNLVGSRKEIRQHTNTKNNYVGIVGPQYYH